MKIELGPHERLDDLVLDGMKVIQRDDQFCFSIDTVLSYKAIIAEFGNGRRQVPFQPSMPIRLTGKKAAGLTVTSTASGGHAMKKQPP